jgi:hypothetical protein
MSLEFTVPGDLGNIAGPASDGVLVGQLTAADPSSVLLKSLATTGLAFTDDGGLYVDETTPFGEATADDVEVLPTTPAVDDAFYVGHATEKFTSIFLNTTTQGDGTWTIAWEYWNGTTWAAVTGLTDGTAGFTSATGWATVVFAAAANWAKNTVDGVDGYWVRARVATYSAVTTEPQVGQGFIKTVNATWVDDTEDFTDVGTADVLLLPTYPLVGDGLYVGYSEKFCKLKVTTSTARTGTATLALKYWNGSAWAAVTTIDDDSAGWSTAAGTHYIHFTPPADWVANTAANGPNGVAGFFVVMELTVLTDVTAQPVATQGWVYPIKTGASGMNADGNGKRVEISMMAQTASGAAADSKFIVVNCTRGISAEFTWTKADPQVNANVVLRTVLNDDLAIVQITEDGTTEFADAVFSLRSA